jgi:hypothetical protein
MALTSFYAGAALVGLLFPLDIMMAADANPKAVYQRGGWQRWAAAGCSAGSRALQQSWGWLGCSPASSGMHTFSAPPGVQWWARVLSAVRCRRYPFSA